MDWINGKIIEAASRHLAQFIGGAMLARGYITDEQNTLFLGATMAVVAFLWSFVQARLDQRNANVTKAVKLAGGETKADVDDILKNVMNKKHGV